MSKLHYCLIYLEIMELTLVSPAVHDGDEATRHRLVRETQMKKRGGEEKGAGRIILFHIL